MQFKGWGIECCGHICSFALRLKVASDTFRHLVHPTNFLANLIAHSWEIYPLNLQRGIYFCFLYYIKILYKFSNLKVSGIYYSYSIVSVF